MKINRKLTDDGIPRNSFQRKAKLFRRLIFIVFFLLLLAISSVFALKMEDIVEGRGVVAGKREYYMKSRVRSTISSINFKSGDFVRKGEVILSLDDRDYQEHRLKLANSIIELEAEIRSIESAIEVLKLDPLPKEYRHSEITFNELKKREVRELESLQAYRNLQKKGAIPLVEINKHEINFLHNQSERQRMERDVELIRRGLGSAIIAEKLSLLNLKKIRLANLKKEAEFHVRHHQDYIFTAPEDGYISYIPTKIGIYIDSGDDVVIFAAKGDKKFVAGVDEKDIYKIQEGQRVRVKSNQYNYLEHGYFYGTIYAVDELPREVNGSTFYTVRINLEDKVDKPLRLGSTGGVEILTGRDFIFKILFDNMR